MDQALSLLQCLASRAQQKNKENKLHRKLDTPQLLFLAEHFAVEIYAYAVMSNHYHIVLRYDPNAVHTWSDA
ncbi:MAG: hypothetical protein QGF47_13575, partial [Arenicellales bacterium]|nr:hypothetical protein [Arenicellales bacterium]